MDLLTMRTQLRKLVGNPDTTDVPDVDLTGNLNTAYVDLSSRFRFHRVRKLCVFETESGTDKYGLPTDCEAVLQVRDVTNGVKLEKGGARDEAWLDPERVDGMPLEYYRFRDWLQLNPTPDAVYEIEVFYKAAVTALADDADEPIVPASWHEGIVKLARHKFYDEKGDIPKAQYALAIYQSWLSTKTIEVDEEKVDIDRGVIIPTLRSGRRGESQQAFDRCYPHRYY